MSLDIWLTIPPETEEVVSRNITHNLKEMWSEAGVYEVLYESEGKTAAEVIPTLQKGLGLMLEKPEYFKQFNATNSWGTYGHAITWLSDLIVEFHQQPTGIIGISK